MKLLLHFDVNKTIIIRDADVPVPEMVNSLLSESVWGWFVNVESLAAHYECSCETVQELFSDSDILCAPFSKRDERHWHILSSEVSSLPLAPPESIVQKVLELLKATHLPNSVDPFYAGMHVVTFGEYLEEHTFVEKSHRKRLKSQFTDSHGMGSSARLKWEELVEQLTVTSDIGSHTFLPTFSGVRYVGIVPSFFVLAEYLAVKQAQGELDFRLVLRTFGSDLEAVADEWNLWCKNEHPMYKLGKGDKGQQLRFDGTVDGFADRRLYLDTYSAGIHRSGLESTDIQMNISTDTFLSSESSCSQEVICGGWAIMQRLLGDWLGPGKAYTVAIRDDYRFWASTQEACHAGKLFALTLRQHLWHCADSNATPDPFSSDGKSCPASTHCWSCLHSPEPSIVQMFFDDNIERNRAHIVDVRYGPDDPQACACQASTAAHRHLLHVDTQSFWSTHGKAPPYLRKVQPVQAILDKQYYVREVQNYVNDISKHLRKKTIL